MGGYSNDELRHRQQTGDVGHAVLANAGSGGAGRKRRALLFPLGVLALGVLLMFVGPLPGLGLMLCIGGLFALPIIAIKVWLSP